VVTPNLPARLAREITSASTVTLDLEEGLSFERWCKVGEQLCAMGRGVQWWTGSWWAFGEARYGERAKAAASGIFGRSFGGLMNLASVSRAFETSRRREVLSFTHHAEVAALEPAEADALLDEAVRDDLSTRDLRARVAAVTHRKRLEKVEANSLVDAGPLPAGRRYPIIYVDPPWRYENPPIGASNRSIEAHYKTLTLEQICATPVADIAADHALLYLWATSPKLCECMQVITAWGFEYRTNLAWVKDKIGTGYHARAQHELLLIAKRGEMPAPLPGTQSSSVIFADRPDEHSEKPDVFYELIEGLYPGVGKIELFARNRRDGWAAWGNQVPAAAAE
jgi:N6-adenosine-specific RNA methylase IME4